jgi:hypothetical protein
MGHVVLAFCAQGNARIRTGAVSQDDMTIPQCIVFQERSRKVSGTLIKSGSSADKTQIATICESHSKRHVART